MAPLIHENESFSPYQSNASSSKSLPRESAKSIPSSHTGHLELVLSEAPDTLHHVLKMDTDGGALCNGNSAGVDNTFKILQLAWALTTSCFTSANSLLFDWDSNSGISCLKALSTGQGSQFGDQLLIIEPDDSLRQVLDKLATTQRRARECAKQTGNSDAEGSTDMFSTAFRYRNASASNSEINSEVDIFLDVTDARDGRLLAELVFSSQAIADPLALSVLHTFDHVLSSIRMSPDITVEEVNMCSPHDRQHITQLTSHVSESNERCLHDMFLEHSHINPDAQAVVSWDGDLTYGELDDLTSRLSHRLVDLGVGPEVFVLSCFKKSTWAIVSRLAILRAGGAYISIDAADPPAYLTSVIQRANAKIMLTVAEFSDQFQGLVPNIIELSKDGILSLPKKVEPACTTVRPTNACLILFTSGSTGEPKGIIQEHRTYATAVRDYARILGLDAGTRMYQFDDYAFDISNNDYLVPLSVGGCCCVPHPQKAIHVLKQHMNDLRANVSFLTPTVAIQLGPEDVPGLKTLCIGGEPPSNDLLSKWAGKVKLVNQYGMGEVATFCTYNDQMSPGSGTNVGRTGTGAAWVVSPASPERLMPVGAVGEMIMEGPHLARGYLDQISRKSEAGFLQYTPKWLHELHPERASSARLYRSGDLVKYNHDGTLTYVGRKDTLLKIDGGRVDAIEVEYTARKCLSPEDSIVVDLLGAIDGVESPILTAFLYLADNPMNLSSKAGPNEPITFRTINDNHSVYSKVELIKKTIGATLPEIQIPTLFLLVDRIPRTKSNKTDRRKLHMLGQNYYMPQREAPSGGAGDGNPKPAAGRVAPKEGPVPASNSNGGMNGTKKRQVRELDATDDLQPKRQKQVC
ncbi:lysergyl peptide synthetase LpsB, NRPS-like enzyme [Histoplasma capsulatum G186AR]|uniref:Lysergyl peptide synthetase LpsB, NRPS-like enzyme n=1 Tax=Ajellomyces capsulatus TaxID=5037 RepID=A0A8H8CVL1_AJECA|nr:lysergyl peptide synthetase LpsB, NRPS-like enzyme [Histoplasma capsulatum]QSS68637.1 lysergyl peptide synthetase LpsB, NRPS-like enzyme [Histoplasma capsulatum G186AR]